MNEKMVLKDFYCWLVQQELAKEGENPEHLAEAFLQSMADDQADEALRRAGL